MLVATWRDFHPWSQASGNLEVKMPVKQLEKWRMKWTSAEY
jgi:hypothetical protein